MIWNSGITAIIRFVWPLRPPRVPGWGKPSPRRFFYAPHFGPLGKSAGLAGAPKKRTQTEPVRVSFRRVGKGSGLTLVEKLPMHPAGKEELLKKFKKNL